QGISQDVFHVFQKTTGSGTEVHRAKNRRRGARARQRAALKNEMKILHTVEFYSPSVGGAQEVVRQVSEQLASRGHHVTVATTNMPARRSGMTNGVHIEAFDISGNAVRGFKGETHRYQ